MKNLLFFFHKRNFVDISSCWEIQHKSDCLNNRFIHIAPGEVIKVYMTVFLICSINSPQCTDMCSKEKFSLAIFLYQKHQISLPVGYKTARSKTGHWEWLWRHFRTSSLAKKQISQSFSYCELINSLRNGIIVHCLQENKMPEKSVFCEAWSPEMTSYSFPVSCFLSRDFVAHWKWNLTLLVHQNTGKENRCQKNLLPILVITLGKFNRA